MFDQFRVVVFAFTGKLKDSPTIRRYFWVFLVGIGMAIIILAYNAFMSLNFYREILARFTPWENLFLPVLATSSIALTVYLLMSSITGTILDYLGGREYKTKGHEPLFIAVILALVGFLCLDIYANLHGVEYVARRTTTAVNPNQGEALFDKVQLSIAEKEETLTRLTSCQIKGYCWKGHLTKDGRAFQQTLSKDISALRNQQTSLISSAISDHQSDKNRFSQEVAIKRKSHIRLVWFAYPIAFLICFIIQHFVDRALNHVEGNATLDAKGSAIHFDSPIVENGLPIGFHQEGSDTPLDPHARFLSKWKEAIDLILAGHSNKEVINLYEGPQGQIRGTTIQKLKTVLRAQGKLSS